MSKQKQNNDELYTESSKFVKADKLRQEQETIFNALHKLVQNNDRDDDGISYAFAQKDPLNVSNCRHSAIFSCNF